VIEKSNRGICPLCPSALCKALWRDLSPKTSQGATLPQNAFGIAEVPSHGLSPQSLIGGICPPEWAMCQGRCDLSLGVSTCPFPGFAKYLESGPSWLRSDAPERALPGPKTRAWAIPHKIETPAQFSWERKKQKLSLVSFSVAIVCTLSQKSKNCSQATTADRPLPARLIEGASACRDRGIVAVDTLFAPVCTPTSLSSERIELLRNVGCLGCRRE
jgi:hypothetical protein